MKKLVLAIGAHPDDIEIGCSGTLCLLRMQGYEVVHLIVTSGEEGSLRSGKDKLALIRQSEAQKAADVIGATKVIFLNAPDGFTFYSKELKIQMITHLRELRPEIVFTHSKSDHFADHALVHELTMSAILASGGPWYSEAGDSPHQVQKVFGYEVWNPIPVFQTAINIQSTIDMKIAALKQHQSQIKDVNYIDAVIGLARYRGIMSMTGPSAEVFEVLKAGSIL